MTEENDITQAQRCHSNVLARLDESGGEMETLFNILREASEEGYNVESDIDRLMDVDNSLHRAFKEVDSREAEGGEVFNHVSQAQTDYNRFVRGLDENLKNFENPDHIDSGIYDTFGGFVEYVERSIEGTYLECEEWVMAEKE